MDKRESRDYQGKRVAAPTEETADHGAGGRREKTGAPSGKRGFWHDYGFLLITVLVVVVLFRGIFQLAYVPSGSMETTIPANSLLIAWRLPYLIADPDLDRGDVAIFWDEEMGKILVKRVVGLEGESISFSGGHTYIDGEKLEEPYLPEQGITVSDKVFQVPEDSLFMMGDNRNGSWDSRFLSQPYISLQAVQGKALVCIPLKQITLFESPKLGRVNIYLPLFGDTHTL